MLKVETSGEVTHLYVGYRRVPVIDGQVDPIRLAAAQLRHDCTKDREAIMREFRRKVYGW